MAKTDTKETKKDSPKASKKEVEGKKTDKSKDSKETSKKDNKSEKFVRADLSKVDAKQLTEMKAAYKKMAMDIRMSKQNNTAVLKSMRKDIARAATILNSSETK